MSPRSISDFHESRTSWPTLSSESIACSSVPSPSRSVAKHNLPVSRLKMIRPVSDSMSPVATSISRPTYFSRISMRDFVRGTETGYGSMLRSINEARFSRRMRSCSGRSSSIGSFVVLIGCEVYRVRHFVRELGEVQSGSNQAHGGRLFLKLR